MFDPVLGYIFIGLLISSLISAEGYGFRLRSISSVHLLLGAILSFAGNDLHQTIFSVAYILSCLVSLLLFVVYGRVGTQRFGLFCVFLIGLSLVTPYMTVVRVLLAILSIIVLRIAVLFVRENTVFFTRLGARKASVVGLIAASYWIPFAVAMYASSYMTNHVQSLVEAKLYEEGLVQKCAPRPEGASPALRDDIDCTVEKVAGDLKVSLDAQLKKAVADTTGTVQAFPERVRAQLEQSIEREPAALRPSSCGFLSVGCWIANAIKRSAMRAYQSAREASINRIYADTLASSKKANATTQDVAASLSVKIPEYTDSSSNVVRKSARGAFATYDIVNIVLDGLLVLAALKSFIYIYARIAFGRERTVFIDAVRRKPIARPGTLAVHTNVLDVPGGKGVKFYKARNEPAANFPPRVALPSPFSALVARIVSGRYLMDATRPGFDRIGFSSPQGRTFVQWDLGPDESVIVNDFSRVLLIDARCRITSQASLKLSTLMLGKMIFPVIEGPGTVVFYATGQAQTTGKNGYDLERFTAWRGDTAFEVRTNPGFIDTYLSGIQVSALRPESVYVVDPAGRPKWFGGALPFLRTFVVPF